MRASDERRRFSQLVWEHLTNPRPGRARAPLSACALTKNLRLTPAICPRDFLPLALIPIRVYTAEQVTPAKEAPCRNSSSRFYFCCSSPI
jgi:hypothetical protein